MFKYFLICVLFAIVFAQRPGVPPTIGQTLTDADYNDCINLNNATQTDLENLFPGKDGKDAEIPANILCFMKCVAQKSKLIAEDGTIDIVAWKGKPEALYPVPEKKGSVDKCIEDIKKIEECADMKKIHICYRK